VIKDADGPRYWPPLLAAAVVRLLWVALIPVRPMGDAVAYDVLARNLAAGIGFGWSEQAPTAYWGVGAPWLYSWCYHFLGDGTLGLALLNVALSVGIVALTMGLGSRWYGPRAAVRAGWLLALFPSQIQFTTLIVSEIPFTLLMLGAWRAWWMPRGPSPGRAALAAVLVAAACYVRPTGLLLPVVMAVSALASTPSRRQLATATAVLVAGVVLLVAPWCARNTARFGQPTGMTTSFGINLWFGNNPDTRGLYMKPPVIDLVNEAHRDAYFRNEAVGYILDHPVRFVGRCALKAVRLNERDTIGIGWNEQGLTERLGTGKLFALKCLNQLAWVLLLVTATLGLFVAYRRHGWKALLAPPVLVIAYFTVIHAVTVADHRYHVPLVPFMAMLAGATFTRRRAAPDSPRTSS